MNKLRNKISNLSPATKRVIIGTTVVGLSAASIVLFLQNRELRKVFKTAVDAIEAAGLEAEILLVPIKR